MDTPSVSSSEANSSNPAAAKRPKLESPADNDEDISIIEARLPQVSADDSMAAGTSHFFVGDVCSDNQDSKTAEFREKMQKYEAEASHLRTQLKRAQEKAQNADQEKVKAVGVREHYEKKYEEERKRANTAVAVAEQKAAAAEKKEKDLQKQCERLTTKVQSKEAEVDFRDKELAKAAKKQKETEKKVADAEKKAGDANKEAAEAKKTASDAEQRATDVTARAAAADTKNAAVEKEASDLRQKVEELKQSKSAEEQKLKARVRALENRIANGEVNEHPSSSTDEELGERLSDANKRLAQKDNEITKLRADIDKLKKDLQVSKAKATRLENARDRPPDNDYCAKDDEIESLKEQIVDLGFQHDKEIRRLENEIEDLEKRAYPATLVEARLQTSLMRQAIGRFDGISERIEIKCCHEGVLLKSEPSRPTLPNVLLELKPSFFEKYECSAECFAQTDYSPLLKGFASQTEKEQCLLRRVDNRVMGIHFKRDGEKFYDKALSFDNKLEWSLTEDNTSYACIFEMNSFVLAQAARELSPMLLEFSNRGQPNTVVITDSEEHLIGDQRKCLWRSPPGDTPHANDFRADFSGVTPDTHQRIYVDSKLGSKTVEVAISKDILRLRYGNEHFSLTYFIPTVKPDENGERCYSPIEFGHEVFEI